MPRKRATTHCDEIARLLAQGYRQADIARRLELSQPLVSRRVETMRIIVSQAERDATERAAWREGKPELQVALRYLELIESPS